MLNIFKKFSKSLKQVFSTQKQVKDQTFKTQEERQLYLRALEEKVHKLHLIENKTESLWDSVCSNRKDDVQFLIEQGADLNALHSWGWTPLVGAIQRKNNKIAKMLIDAGADITTKCDQNLTALHWAGICRQTVIGKWLIEKGAAIDARDEHGDTPLLIAAEYGSDCLVKTLIQAGADVHLCSHIGNTALIKAVSKEAEHQVTYEILRGVLRFFTPDQKEKMVAFSAKRYQNIIKTLINAGVDIDAQNKFGETALILAAQNGNAEQVQLLLQAGANPYLRNYLGKTAKDYWKKHQLNKILKGEPNLIKPVRGFDVCINIYAKNLSQHFKE